MLTNKRSLKVLIFDIENRPLSYWADRPTAEITAIASVWANDISTVEVKLLGVDSPEDMLNSFLARYNEADVVVGHYIRRHDLPIINGALMEYGLGVLAPKLTVDTRLDMFKKGDIPATQEYLAELFGLPFDKVHMTQHKWRAANRLTPEGIEATRKRVVGDILQNMTLRSYMVSHNLLKAPRTWSP